MRLTLLGAFALTVGFTPAQIKSAPAPEGNRQALLDSIAPECRRAQAPGDLDPLWARLNALLANTRSREAELEGIQEIDGAIFLVEQWRSYLEAHCQGNQQAAFSALETLLDETNWLSVAPRSLVLDRYRERFKYFHTEYPTRTVGDIRKAIAALQQLERQVDKPGGKKEAIDQLEALWAAWELRHDHDWKSMEAACKLTPGDSTSLIRFKHLVLAHAVVGFLGLNGRTQLTPLETEPGPEFIDRLIAEAKKNRDFLALWRLQAYRLHLNQFSPAWQRSQLIAIGGYLEGQKTEAAGDWTAALQAYRLAVSRAGNSPVVDAAIPHLRTLEKTHPEAVQNLTGDDGITLLRTLTLALNPRLAEANLPQSFASPFDPPRKPAVPAWQKY